MEGFVGSREIQDVAVNGTATFHDATGGSQRGQNRVYVVQLDGLAFCHLGDLGHDLTTEQITELGANDVLFVPVGGGPTIGPEVAAVIVERLKPTITVPMHYNMGIPGMPEFFNRLNHVGDFLKGKTNVKKLESRSFEVTKAKLPKEPTIIVPHF